MNKIFDKFTFILAFLIFIVFWNMLLGKKATESLLWVILIGMLLTNSDKLSNLMKKKSDNKTTSDATKPYTKKYGIFETPQTSGNTPVYV